MSAADPVQLAPEDGQVAALDERGGDGRQCPSPTAVSLPAWISGSRQTAPPTPREPPPKHSTLPSHPGPPVPLSGQARSTASSRVFFLCLRGQNPEANLRGRTGSLHPPHPMTLSFIHGLMALPRLGSKVGVSLLGKVKSRGWFPERPLDHRPNRGCFLLPWGLRPCQAISPNPAPHAPEQRAQQLLLTSSSPSRPGGWSAGRRRGRCPGKRASPPRRPQLLEGSRTPSTPITAPRAQRTLTTSPLKC